MKIVIAPDSFKESLSAEQVAKAIHSGFASIFPDADYHLLPIADGGEGTVQALTSANGGSMETTSVTGPLGLAVNACIAFSNDSRIAFIEMAEACGLHLVPLEERNPLKTTSFGVGELILHAIEQGAKELIIGVGGSSTNDGGIGMASALGYQFFDKEGHVLQGAGQDLFNVVSMSDDKVDQRVREVKITIAADVENPLLGENGATYIYGPQKGLDLSLRAEVDQAMGQFYKLAEGFIGKKVIGIPGSGAGGGIGAGLLLFAQSTIKKGIELVLEHLHVKDICRDADIVIVGEGSIDGQTIYGKAPVGVAGCVPKSATVIAICGGVGTGSELLYDHGIDAIFPTVPSIAPKETIINNAYENIERTARNVAALIRRKGE
jgi:glycerate 2-kinase